MTPPLFYDQETKDDIEDKEYFENHKEELEKLGNEKLRKLLPKGFLSSIDKNFRKFCNGIKENLRKENYEILAITGYAGTGKSQLGAITGALIDDNYSFKNNINFLPTADEIENDYLKLKMYSYLHIDEASRSIHKHKWFEKTQQKLSELYDTERENHYIASCLIMPRFQNFTENFRNFFIKYWINIPIRGLAIVYKRDEDKDNEDPWNVKNNYKLKQKAWRGKRIYERTIYDILRIEQKTKNYWFYFLIPEIPKDVWIVYKYLKRQSRIEAKKNTEKTESRAETLRRQHEETLKQIKYYLDQGLDGYMIAAQLKRSVSSVMRYKRELEAIQRLQESTGNE